MENVFGAPGESVYNEITGTQQQRKGRRHVEYRKAIRSLISAALALSLFAGQPGAEETKRPPESAPPEIHSRDHETEPPGEHSEAAPVVDVEAAPVTRTDFEVRFIAQPQNRRYIPVTYLPTPESEEEVYPVLDEVLLTGKNLVDLVYEDLGEKGFQFQLKLNPVAAERMTDVTEYGIGEQLALILNGQILFYPYVRDTIHEVIEVRGPVGKNKNHAQMLHAWFARLEK
ncbi:MAG: hypothetical protein HYV27_18300 [Candidatus Hydrogenedentes bacterium]|nr:hypothetical protein [Candidatus Hydrogenedentota bacterium]